MAKVKTDPRAGAKAKYLKALKEGTPIDYPWGDLTPEEREEVLVNEGFISAPEVEEDSE